MCVCVHACVRACVCLCECVRVCVCVVRTQVSMLFRQEERHTFIMFYLLNDLCPLHAPTKLKRLLCLAGLWFSVILVPVFILFQAFEVSRPLCISATCSISISWFSFYLLVVLSLHGPLLSRDLCAHSSIIFWFPAFPAIWQYIFFRPPLFLVYRFDFSYCITAFIFQTCISVGAPLWASCKDGKARPLGL